MEKIKLFVVFEHYEKNDRNMAKGHILMGDEHEELSEETIRETINSPRNPYKFTAVEITPDDLYEKVFRRSR